MTALGSTRIGGGPRTLAVVVAVATALVAVRAAGPVPLSAQVGDPSPPGSDSLPPLSLDDVLRSIESTYPPLLAALIERDIAEGRLRSARSLYDLDLFGKLGGTPDGYYEYTTVEGGAEQFLGVWGTTIYGGYRRTSGEELPDYYEQRTQGDGEATVGLRLPILKGGAIDDGRAGVARAEVELRRVEPLVARQRIDFVRAGTVAYLKWLGAGQKLRIARELLRVANDRTAALQEQVDGGLRADIVLVDNRRLVVSREIAVIDAERAFQGAALSLSLFFRDENGQPVVAGEERLPDAFPDPVAAASDIDPEVGVDGALLRRPELVRLGLDVEAARVDLRLARNGLLPTLDASVEAARNYGENLYVDRSETELRAGLEFKLPLQRRKAGGKVEQVEGKLGQLRRKLAFAREKITAEVRDAAVALDAALRQTQRADLNVELAEELQAAEEALFLAGSSDLLSLQIREQATFDARSKAVEAYLDALTALADYRAAVAEGVIAPPGPPPGSDEEPSLR